ncbi:MAG: GspE/PulE family protein [Opitutales bacterium]
MVLPRLQASIVQNLRDLNLLSEEQAESVLSSKAELSGSELDQVLNEEFKVSAFQLLVAKSRAFNMSPFAASFFATNERTFEKLDHDFCEENKVLPVGMTAGYIVLAVTNPFNTAVTNKVSEMTRRKVHMLLAHEADINRFLKVDDSAEHATEGYGDVVEALDLEFSMDEAELDGDGEAEEAAPIIQLANRIIEDAYYSGGSDIHIEPFEKDCRVRVRVDGVCQEKLTVPVKISRALLARLKVMANLDIAERRLPQDGRIVFKQFTKKPINIDLRVSTAPLNHGEGVVMRILDKSKSTLPLEALGFEASNLESYREIITRPYGMILHCGPTGSGKSMTLYSALNEINTADVCIRTAEDPIEYTLPGLCQMQMQRKIGLTFAAALRAFLRQDPDVILVGEIRDRETASIAVEAALTGHLLFSTLHTNDAAGTVARLTDMEIEPFMISASLLCVCAQRLMRRVCKTCKELYEVEGREQEILQRALGSLAPQSVYRANRNGCSTCNGSGYKGRVGIHEMMLTNEELVQAINEGRETADVKRIAVKNGMATLHQDSMMKVRAGTSTMEECITTVPPDMEDVIPVSEMPFHKRGKTAPAQKGGKTAPPKKAGTTKPAAKTGETKPAAAVSDKHASASAETSKEASGTQSPVPAG